MGRDKKSRVIRRRGCLGGCLSRLLLLLGLAALLFVAATQAGLLPGTQPASDGTTSAAGTRGRWLQALGGLIQPGAYRLEASGLTLKTLRAGKGEAVLVCMDGYTMLLGGGSGTWGTGLQLLMCGVNRLDAAIAMSCAEEQLGGMPFALQIARPSWVFYPDTQTRGKAYASTMREAGSAQLVAAHAGMSFTLGRGTVRFLGPVYTHHTDERDDGLSLRIDYGGCSFLILGGITEGGERELLASEYADLLDADVLVCALGGAEGATCQPLIEAVSPKIALCTGEASWQAKARLERAGAQVYSSQQTPVITVRSDGVTLEAGRTD